MRAIEKQKPVWGDGVVALLILAVAVLILVILPSRGGDKLTAVVMVDGEQIWTCPLAGVNQPMVYTVEGDFPLTLEVSSTGVRVAEAFCRGEDCRHTGAISSAGQQIVCLPNRTVVTLQGDNPSFDAVVG